MAKRKRVGHLHAKLTLNSSQFSRGLKRVTMKLKAFGLGIARLSARLAKFSAIVITGVVVALAAITRASLKTLDAVAKTADKLGVGTKALMGLHLAANQTGVDVEKLNKALTLQNRRVGEAATGVGEAVEAFKMLRIDIGKVIKQDAVTTFEDIAGALMGLKNASLQASVAADIWGRSGVDLLNLAAIGTSGIRAFRAEAERLGFAFTRFDLAKIEAANDAIDKMKKATAALGHTFTVQIAPFLTAFATAFTDASGMSDKIKRAFDAIALSMARMLDSIHGLMLEMKGPAGVFVDEAAKRTAAIAKVAADPIGTHGRALKTMFLAGAHLLGFKGSGAAERIPPPPIHEPRRLPGPFELELRRIQREGNLEARMREVTAVLRRAFGGQPMAAEAGAGGGGRLGQFGLRTMQQLGIVGGMPNVAAFGQTSPVVKAIKDQSIDIKAIRTELEFVFRAARLGGRGLSP